MGRLIDADKLIAKIEEIYDGYMLSEDVGVVPKDFVEFLEEAPTVEAIPKTDYENRLKADMTAILEEIQLELDEMKIAKVRSAGFAPYSKDPFRRGVNCSKEIIQQKIDSLKGDKE